MAVAVLLKQADDRGHALDAFQQAQDHLAFDDQDVAVGHRGVERRGAEAAAGLVHEVNESQVGLPKTAPSTTIAEPEP